MPSVIAYVESPHVAIEDAVTLLQRLLAHVGRHQMFALLHPIVQLFAQRFDREISVGGSLVDAIDIISKYKGFIQFLRFFQHKQSGVQQPLPSPVRQEIYILVSHLIDTLESLPSASDPRNQPHLTEHFLHYIFRRRFLTPELRKLLLKHTFRHDIELTPFQWQQCTFSAIDEEDSVSAEKYRLRWKETLAKKRSEGEAGYFDNNDNKNSKRSENGTSTSEGDEDEDIALDASLQRSRTINKLIRKMVISRWNQSIHEIIRLFEPHLSPTRRNGHLGVPDRISPSSRQMRTTHLEGEMERGTENFDTRTLLRFAWSILLDRCSKDEKITTEALLEMAETLPGEAIVGHTLTPIMYGLIKRGEPLKAWEIWRDLIEQEKQNANSTQKGLFVDRVTLAVATEACHAATDLDAAVTLVDTWAKKVTSTENEKDNENSSGEEWAGSVKLDDHNINILLNFCRQDGKSSIAFRIWEAAVPRYGVFLNDVSLNLLLDIARYSNEEPEMEDDILSQTRQRELFRRRLRAIADEFSFRQRRRPTTNSNEFNGYEHGQSAETDANEKYDEDIWSQGPTSILLDNTTNGLSEMPWQKARSIFRQVVLGNWPFLQNVHSPLDLAHQGMFGSFVSFFSPRSTSTSIEIPRPADKGGQSAKSLNSEIHLPVPNARYTHIIPTSRTFRSYIALLGYYNLHAEIPTALAWMKELGIRPTWSTMCLALLHICENEGPRRWVKGFGEDGGMGLVRDEEIIRRWLIDWLGSGEEPIAKGKWRKIVPTEQDVAGSRRWLAERRQRLTA
ncbi:uncharacterized protein I303_105385 [Kwoniella dejecticola CBS 10117]|uniref:Uncharacterized protein n=1 Tax=Kwoniella dejecticola CBS 10117 TaxID=1296121 RepID=A0A1A6A2M7_9TREE|nr:uncharacterized protein I303_05170 [Kwoniella dejecticola CBS 10117]OBR84312.1 hypothetical protein I303_05170 [Kwoniella dejecticola CBS 10117]